MLHKLILVLAIVLALIGCSKPTSVVLPETPDSTIITDTTITEEREVTHYFDSLACFVFPTIYSDDLILHGRADSTLTDSCIVFATTYYSDSTFVLAPITFWPTNYVITWNMARRLYNGITLDSILFSVAGKDSLGDWSEEVLKTNISIQIGKGE